MYSAHFTKLNLSSSTQPISSTPRRRGRTGPLTEQQRKVATGKRANKSVCDYHRLKKTKVCNVSSSALSTRAEHVVVSSQTHSCSTIRALPDERQRETRTEPLAQQQYGLAGSKQDEHSRTKERPLSFTADIYEQLLAPPICDAADTLTPQVDEITSLHNQFSSSENVGLQPPTIDSGVLWSSSLYLDGWNSILWPAEIYPYSFPVYDNFEDTSDYLPFNSYMIRELDDIANLSQNKSASLALDGGCYFSLIAFSLTAGRMYTSCNPISGP